MNVLLAMAEPDTGGQIQQIATTFGVDWSHLVAQIISFSIVCVLLHRFAYKPVLKMLEERRQQIAQGLSDTKKIAAELARTESQRQEIMLQANANATRLIEEARTAARQVHQE
jgi:F-type H+-transporting ATPase subunit b